MAHEDDTSFAKLDGDDLLLIARKLAATRWTAEQLDGVSPLTQGLVEGINALQRFNPSDALPALDYELPEWE